MDNNSDLTFITNEDYTLLDRFEKLVPKYTKKFDCLVGYFYMSGFYKMWPNLEDLEKIRILVGIGVDKNIANFNLFSQEKTTKEAKEDLDNRIKNEIYRSEDSEEIEIGIKKFVEWIQSGKLEIKAYKKHPIHSKLYIMTFDEDNSPDVGRVITGSSNLTQAGLISNLEFNVELKNSSDYNFALNSFEKLWLDAIDVGEVYIDTVLNKTHLSDKITPYELYLKFLYEYFEEDGNYIFTMAQFYPRLCMYNDVLGWQNHQFTGRGEFTVCFGDFKVEMTVPADHIVGGTGVCKNYSKVLSKTQLSRYKQAESATEPLVIKTLDEVKAGENTKATAKKTWVFEAKNVRDFAWTSSRRFVWDAMPVTIEGNKVMCMSFYAKEAYPIYNMLSTKPVATILKPYSNF